MNKLSREDVAKLFTWDGPPAPPVEGDGDGGNREMWLRVFNAIDYQVYRMDKGNRACNDLISVREISKSAKVTPDFARQVMRDLSAFSRAIAECFERL